MLETSWFHTEITEEAKSNAALAIAEDQFTNGNFTKLLEKEISQKLNVPYCMYTNSGTSALSIALIASNIKRGSKIATSSIGWIATPQAIRMVGADVYVTDVLENVPVMNTEVLLKSQGDIDGIIIVNYNGRQVDINSLKNNLNDSISIIEDSCKSLFSMDYNNNGFSGTNGDFGCYSLGMVSMLPGVYGGLVSTNNLNQIETLNRIKWHGTSSLNGKESYQECSYNFKTSNVHAAIAYGMIEGIEERKTRINAIYEMYKSELEGLENNILIPINTNKGEIPLLIDIKSKNRKAITKHLNSHGIQTCNYHRSLSHAEYVKNIGSISNSEIFGDQVFHPPCGPDQPMKNIEKSIKLIKELG